jgi:5-formyltetrahydrofolate cyclo-ligase
LVKADLRTSMRIKRQAAAVQSPDSGERLCAHVPSDLVSKLNPVVAGYFPFKSEIDPRPLMRFLRAKGANLCLPRTPTKGHSDQALTFHLCDPDDPEHLEKSAWGVMEPKATRPQVRPDLVLVPLIAFDRAGNRLGQGQGHYDRTLAALRASGPVIAVGVAYGVQEVEHIPAEPHDQRLDWIITEIEAYRVPSCE